MTHRGGCPPRVAGGVIASVAEGSVGEEIGLEPGDALVSINGHALRDVIDYRYYGAEEELVLVVDRQGERHRLVVERDYGEDLGLDFVEPVFDGMRLCANRCPFCFVSQLPPGLRRSLYLRDDDYRYSFLSASYITLTNLTPEDWDRIGEQHLSPLYVSIHASDNSVRRAMLGRPDAPDIMAQLVRLAELDIRVHGQVVIVPGMNDGEVLWRTVDDVCGLWPTVQTLALVPVGLTAHHSHGLRLLRSDEAQDIVREALGRVPGLRATLGKTWLYPSDELFLIAGEPIPDAAFYDDPAQMDNGVGLVRALLDDWATTRGRAGRLRTSVRRITLVCGTGIAPILGRLAAELGDATGVEVGLVPVTNRLFGETVTVSGLLCGGDVLRALEGVDLGERTFVPAAMFEATGTRTLDEYTLDELRARLGVPVVPVSTVGEVLACL